MADLAKLSKEDNATAHSRITVSFLIKLRDGSERLTDESMTAGLRHGSAPSQAHHSRRPAQGFSLDFTP